MKKRKAILAFLTAICMIALAFTLGVYAEGESRVTASTDTVKQQGSYGYCYVYIDDLTDLASLTVAVHYDTESVDVMSSYNRVGCTLYDSSDKDGCLQYSYIFDGEGSNTKTQLFYFYYKINENAPIGNTYFDIVISDAYNTELEAVNISGSRTNIAITEKTVSKSCYVYPSSDPSTSVNEEFTVSYRLSTYQIASGSFEIKYDSELFEFVDLTQDGFLQNKVVDVNSNLDGAVAVSFVGTSYNYSTDLVTVRFRALKNVTEQSEIKLNVTDFYDLDLNLITCQGCTSSAYISFDDAYTEDAPSMSLSSVYNAETGKVTLTVRIDGDSHLGAGDFVIKFDNQKLKYVSSNKEFSPTFFNVNDKNVSDGIFKFSVISTEDITSEQAVITLVFDAVYSCEDKIAKFEISGSGLTDSLTNSIVINFVDSNVVIPLKHLPGIAVIENEIKPSCNEDGSYDSVIYCSECKAELSREQKTSAKLGHSYTNYVSNNDATCLTDGTKTAKCDRCDETDTVTDTDSKLGHDRINHNAKSATCTEIGWDAYETCSRCDYTTYVEISALGHNYSAEWTVDVEPTCTEVGSKSHHCTRCDLKSDVTEVSSLGHGFTNYVSDNNATCLTDGTKTAKCVRCDVTDTVAEVDSKLGHSFANYVSDNNATCLVDGTKTAKCDRCDETDTVADEGSALGHDFADATCTDPKTCKRDGCTVTEGNALGHSFTNYVSDNNATCTEDGTKTAKCDRCDETDTVTDANTKLGHDFADATCTDPKTCKRDGCTVTEGNALGHSFTNYVSDNNATCTEDGTKTAKCVRCDETDTVADVDSKLGHDFADATCTSPKTCKRDGCNATDGAALGHTYDNACDGDCNVCNEERTPSNHVWDGGSVTKEPTKEEEGVKTYTCTVCGETKTESVPKLTGCGGGGGALFAIMTNSAIALVWFALKKKH